MGGGASKTNSAANTAATQATQPSGQATLQATAAEARSGGPAGSTSAPRASPRGNKGSVNPRTASSTNLNAPSAGQRARQPETTQTYASAAHGVGNGAASAAASVGGSASGSGGTRSLHVGRHLLDVDPEDIDGGKSGNASEVEDASEEAMQRAIKEVGPQSRILSAGRRREQDRTTSPVASLPAHSINQNEVESGVAARITDPPLPSRKRPLSGPRKRPLSATEAVLRGGALAGDVNSSCSGVGNTTSSSSGTKPRVASAKRSSASASASSISGASASSIAQGGAVEHGSLKGIGGLGGSAWIDNSDFHRGISTGLPHGSDQAEVAQKPSASIPPARPKGMKSNIVSGQLGNLPRIQKVPSAQQREFMKDLHDSIDDTMTPRVEESLGRAATTDVRSLMQDLNFERKRSSKIDGAASFNERFASCSFKPGDDSALTSSGMDSFGFTVQRRPSVPLLGPTPL